MKQLTLAMALLVIATAHCAPMLTPQSKPLELKPVSKEFFVEPEGPETQLRPGRNANLVIQDVTDYRHLSMTANPEKAGWYIIRACNDDKFCITFDLDEENAKKLKAAVIKHEKAKP